MDDDFKVLVDKSVLISSSIRASIEALEKDISHQFYQIAARLMNRIEENRGKGIVTNQIENLSRQTLVRAVRETLEDLTDLEGLEDFEGLSNVISIANNKLDNRIRTCDRISLSDSERKKYHVEVAEVYTELQPEFWDEVHKDIDEEVRRKVQRSAVDIDERTKRSIARGMRDPAYSSLKNKIIKQPVEAEDMEILMSAVFFDKERFPDKKIVLASCDQHFVKVRAAKESDNKDMVPEKIRQKLGIDPLWPDEASKKYFQDNN